MNLKRIKRLLTILTLTVVFTSIGATFNPNVTNQTMPVASAKAIAPDGPWETDANGLPVRQSVDANNNIYFSIKPGTRYASYARKAAQAWTNLGVINLIEVPWQDPRTQIQITYEDVYSTGEAFAITSFNGGNENNNIAYLDGTNITYYKDMEYENKIGKEIVAEHEFGHALGFEHDNRTLKNGRKYKYYTLTMNARTDQDFTYRLGGIEQRMLSEHYGITPDTWLNTNC